MSQEPKKPEQVKYQMEAANGLMVWVSAEELPTWQARQDEIKAGTYQETPEDRDFKAKLRAEFDRRTAGK
jgi:hypothetical protein